MSDFEDNLDWLVSRVKDLQVPALYLAADVVDLAVDQIKPVKKKGRKLAEDLRTKAYNL